MPGISEYDDELALPFAYFLRWFGQMRNQPGIAGILQGRQRQQALLQSRQWGQMANDMGR